MEMVLDEREREEVKSGVVAVLSNLALEFSPMKQSLIDRGVIEVFVEFLKDGRLEDLRLNAIWALKVGRFPQLLSLPAFVPSDLFPLLSRTSCTALPGPSSCTSWPSYPPPCSSRASRAFLSAFAFSSCSSSLSTYFPSVPLLVSLLSPLSPPLLQAQSLALLRNLLADSTEPEVEDVVNNILTKKKLEQLLEEKTSLLTKGEGMGEGQEEVVHQVSPPRLPPEFDTHRADLSVGEQAVYVLACVVAGSESLRRWVISNESLVASLKLAVVRSPSLSSFPFPLTFPPLSPDRPLPLHPHSSLHRLP